MAENSYSPEREAEEVQTANAAFDKAVTKLVKERDAKIAEVHRAFEEAVAPHAEARDRAYTQAHNDWYQHQYEHGEMSDEARELLGRQLAGEVTWDSAVGSVQVQVHDSGKGADGGR